MKFSQKAIADTTRATYQSAIVRFGSFVQMELGGSPRPSHDMLASLMTSERVGNFLAEMGKGTALQHSTLTTYRSALSTFWEESGLSHAKNPTTGAFITRILDGIKRERREQRSAAAKVGIAADSKPPLVDVSPALLRELAKCLGENSPDPEAQMHWACVTCALFGMFRPSEVLGSARHSRRRLEPEQINFWRDDQYIALLATGTSPHTVATPSHYTVQLFESKCDQGGTNAPHPISEPSAVLAMWVWMHTRRTLPWPQWPSALFQLPGRTALRMRELTDVLQQAVLAVKRERWRFTGKSFRRGGASALMASGASGPDMQNAGRWKSAAMPGTYASAQSKQQRMLAANRQMGASAPFAGLESIRRA